MGQRSLAAWILAPVCVLGHAAPGELVLLAPSNHAMPIADFRDGKLVNGILKDIGEAIAARLHLRARFVTVPSRRVTMALSQGEADGVCYVQPYWIDGVYRWSAPMIPNGALVLAREGAPIIVAVTDLRGVKVGTVAGYRYPVLEEALGGDFVRDDAPTMQNNVRKLVAGRTQYALIEQATAAYEMKIAPQEPLRTDVVYETFKARCAFSLQSKVPFADVSRVIDSLIVDGSVNQIMARYR